MQSNKPLPVYNDGVCEVYTYDNQERILKVSSLRFANRTLGYKRFYAAQAAQNEITRVIRIPFVSGIDMHDYVDIQDEGTYTVEQSQVIMEFTPPCIDLSLRFLEMNR